MSLEEIIQMVLGMILFVGFIVLVISIISTIANWKMFEKAGEKGWKCIIPYYSNYMFLKIAGLDKRLIIFMILTILYNMFSSVLGSANLVFTVGIIIGIANIVVWILINVKLRERFVKENNDKMTLWKFIISLIFAVGIPAIFMFGSKKYKYIQVVENK